MSDLPEPPIGPEVDVRDLDGFMLNVERLLASELWALSTGEEFKAATALWCRAWKQMPAASLPDDERVLAAFAGLTLDRFRELREMVMRGFILCGDGRYYHRTLAEDALRAWKKCVQYRKDRDADRERLRRWREAKRAKKGEPDTDLETVDETRFTTADETGSKRLRQGQGQGQENPSSEAKASSEGARAPAPVALDEVAEAVQLWNDMARRAGLPKIQAISDARRTNLRRRLKDAGGIDGWKAALAKIEATPGLCGANRRKWKADLDFLLQESSFIKLMEGSYDGWDEARQGRQSSTVAAWAEAAGVETGGRR